MVDLVVVGASWGGLAALRTLLHGLPPSFPAALVVVQHRSPESHGTALRQLLAITTPLEVRDATDKLALEGGCVYLAPPGYHLFIEHDHVALSTEGPVAHSRPSIDAALESAAEAYRDRCTGVVLTGANADGARGLARVVELGGRAVVQDPATAERPEMPRAALAAVPDARVAPLEDLPLLLFELCAQEARA